MAIQNCRNTDGYYALSDTTGDVPLNGFGMEILAGIIPVCIEAGADPDGRHGYISYDCEGGGSTLEIESHNALTGDVDIRTVTGFILRVRTRDELMALRKVLACMLQVIDDTVKGETQ